MRKPTKIAISESSDRMGRSGTIVVLCDDDTIFTRDLSLLSEPWVKQPPIPQDEGDDRSFEEYGTYPSKPCHKCSISGKKNYCKNTPCDCECHIQKK